MKDNSERRLKMFDPKKIDWDNPKSVKNNGLKPIFENHPMIDGIMMLFNLEMEMDGVEPKDAFKSVIETATHQKTEKKPSTISQITDNQAEIIGREIGKSIAETFVAVIKGR